MIISNILYRQLKTLPDSDLTILSWSRDFETATVYENFEVRTITRAQLSHAVTAASESQFLSSKSIINRTTSSAGEFSVILVSPNRAESFYIQISTDSSDAESPLLPLDAAQTETTNEPGLFYRISVSCLGEGELLPMSSSVNHVSLSNIAYPPLESQFLSTTEASRLILGCLELDLYHEYEEIEINVRDPNESVFQRALKSFKNQARPLRVPTFGSEILKWNGTSPNNRYAIFDREEISFLGNNTPPGQTKRSFTASGASTLHEYRYIFQFSRYFDQNTGEVNRQEARQFEIFLCVFDTAQERISWLMHTTTGGEMSQGKGAYPETSWALHPRLPLLVWLLPGHKLNISDIESQESPIAIAGKKFAFSRCPKLS